MTDNRTFYDFKPGVLRTQKAKTDALDFTEIMKFW